MAGSIVEQIVDVAMAELADARPGESKDAVKAVLTAKVTLILMGAVEQWIVPAKYARPPSPQLREMLQPTTPEWPAKPHPEQTLAQPRGKPLPSPPAPAAPVAATAAAATPKPPKRGTLLSRLIIRDRGICQICKMPVLPAGDPHAPMSPSVGHIIARSKGGTRTFENTQLEHVHCNNKKGAG